MLKKTNKNQCFIKLLSITIFYVLIVCKSSIAWDRVYGANATLDIEPSARSSGLGGTSMAINDDYLSVVTNPYQLSESKYAWFSLSHTSYYEDTQYDFASAVLPLGKEQGLGISFARFGAYDIPKIQEGEPIPEGEDYNTFSIADWMFSISFGHKFFNRLDLGVGFHGLYRELNQTGYGFRGDIGARFRVLSNLYVSGLLKGWTSSATTWESGQAEYSSPEFYLALSYQMPINYLYGKLGVYLQSEEFFHRTARKLDFDTGEDSGKRFWESPIDFLSGSRGGIEFTFDFGLSLRAGLSSFSTFQSVTAGAGLCIAKFLRIDYAFESHPVLTPIHRVSISISPYLFSYGEKRETYLDNPSSKLLLEAVEENTSKSEISKKEEKNLNEESTIKGDFVEESSSEDSQGGTYWEE